MKLYDIIAPFVNLRNGYRGTSNLIEAIKEIEESGQRKPKMRLPDEFSANFVSHAMGMTASRFYRIGVSLYFTLNKKDIDLMQRFSQHIIVKRRKYWQE